MATIADVENEVIKKVENRTSDVARARIWIRDSVLEITGNPDFRNEFDELEILGPTYNLVVGTQEYAFSNFITAPDVNLATLDFFLWTDPPTNATRRQLTNMDYQEADRINPTNGQPTKWYRFGDTVGFVNRPDKTYQTRARILRQHPIDDVTLQNTVLLVPRDWLEIVCYAAAMRGFIELLEYEKADMIRKLLMGDPKYPDRPGLMYGRKKRKEREDWRKQKTLAPVMRPYGR